MNDDSVWRNGTRPLHGRAALGQTEGGFECWFRLVTIAGTKMSEGGLEIGGRARGYDIYHDQGKRGV